MNRKYIWNTVPSEIDPINSTDNWTQEIKSKDQPLVIPTKSKYSNILNISEQTKSLSDLELLTLGRINNKKINEKLLNSPNYHNSTDSIDNLQTLKKNSKYSRASESEKIQILKLHKEQNLSYSEIANKLMIGYSKVYRIIKSFESFQLDTSRWFLPKPV